MKIKQEKKRQKEIELANKWKQQEEKLKEELRSKIKMKCLKEKEVLEMQFIEKKFGNELEIEVRQEMGLPTPKLPVPQLPQPISAKHGNLGSSYVTPSSITGIKHEKFDHDAYGDPSSPKGHGEKQKDPDSITPPPSKQFATKQDFQQTFTQSKSKGKSPCLQLFSPLGKTSSQSMKEENTLEIRSSE